MLNNIKDICQSQGGLDPLLSTHFRLNSAEGGGEKVFVNSCLGFLDQFSQWEGDVQPEEAGSVTTAEASEAARRSGGRARAPACCHRVTPHPPASTRETHSLLSVSRQQNPCLGMGSKRSSPSSQGQRAFSTRQKMCSLPGPPLPKQALSSHRHLRCFLGLKRTVLTRAIISSREEQMHFSSPVVP